MFMKFSCVKIPLKMLKILAILLICFGFLASLCSPKPVTQPKIEEKPIPSVIVTEKMNGLTFVAPPEPFNEDPFVPIKAIGASWIAVVPYAFTMPNKPNVKYDTNGMHWWGEKPEGINETIRLAHENGIKVMLKPQVYVPSSWTGSLEFENDAAYTQWETDYEKYIMIMAAVAETQKVDLFCIGTEFRKLIEKRPQFWSNLIKKIKTEYHGKLTYSSNWDDWEQVPFWDEMDFIGLGGYFPLVEGNTPPVDSLVFAWQPMVKRLKSISDKHQKPILFTEYGYLSVDGCGWRNWELEGTILMKTINEQAQANCFEAFHQVFQKETWWAGSFLWKWFPNMRGHEGYPERDYTPQGKLGEKTLQKWFKKSDK
jgi:hypothetical protein